MASNSSFLPPQHISQEMPHPYQVKVRGHFPLRLFLMLKYAANCGHPLAVSCRSPPKMWYVLWRASHDSHLPYSIFCTPPTVLYQEFLPYGSDVQRFLCSVRNKPTPQVLLLCKEQTTIPYGSTWAYKFPRSLSTCKSAYYTKVQYFIKYRNTHFKDPITLLSMDIVVERFFGDRCIRPISINTMVARPIVYRSMRNILILSIGLGKQNITISHNILLIMAFLEWLTLRITHFVRAS
jgi:hypothetical protein